MGTIETEPVDQYIDDDQLAVAAQEAVTRSRAEVDRLLIDVELLVAELRASPHRLEPWAGDAPIAEYRRITEALSEGASGDFDRQLDGLDEFNIVMFGRTGAGKSSLLSAMARLDGSSVSLGESDWTTEAREVHWRGVRLVDTPGINGWGRTTSREDLEARARDEVKRATWSCCASTTRASRRASSARSPSGSSTSGSRRSRSSTTAIRCGAPPAKCPHPAPGRTSAKQSVTT